MPPTFSLVELATAIDEVLKAPVLVTGALPPAGRDLDLVARPREFAAVTDLLRGRDFRPWGRAWARFDADGTPVVEVTRAAGWGVRPDHGGEALFTGCVPLKGYRNLVRPGPAVQLVLVAQSLLVRRGALPEGKRRRAEEAAAGGAAVWDEAERIAAELHLTGAVRMLRRLLGTPEPWRAGRRVREVARALAGSTPSARTPVLRQVLPHRVRPVLVSLSGPDGSGKSTQAEHLLDTLRGMGVRAEPAWVPTTMRPPLPPLVRALAERWRHADGGTPSDDASVGGAAPPAPARRGARRVPLAARALEHLWITGAALSNARAMWAPVRRHPTAQVLVLDRFVLDAEIKLEYWYRHRRGVNVGVERRLLRALSPTPDVTVLLTVAPETNHGRRHDEFGLAEFRAFWQIYAECAPAYRPAVVDADRSESEVAADVARVVWSRLP
jgi:thymidylate kinase